MSKLTQPIPSQAFEVIGHQLSVIITDELDNLYQRFNDENLNIENIYKDRFLPFDKTELTAINTVFSDGGYDNQDSRQVDGTYTYNIDVEVAQKSKEDSRGDVASRTKLQKILGTIRAIIMSPHYQRLGLAAPSIANRSFKNIAIDLSLTAKDGINSSMGRLILEVRAPELAEGISPVVAAGYDTEVKVNETEKGFKYTINN